MEIRAYVGLGKILELVFNEERDVLDIVLRDQAVIFCCLDGCYAFLDQLILFLEDLIGIDAGEVLLDERLAGGIELFQLIVRLVPPFLQGRDPLEVGLPKVHAYQVQGIWVHCDAFEQLLGRSFDLVQWYGMALAAPFLAEIIAIAFLLSFAPAGRQGSPAATTFHNPSQGKVGVVPVMLGERLCDIYVPTVQDRLDTVVLLLADHRRVLALHLLVVLLRDDFPGVELVMEDPLHGLGLYLVAGAAPILDADSSAFQELGHLSQGLGSRRHKVPGILNRLKGLRVFCDVAVLVEIA